MATNMPMTISERPLCEATQTCVSTSALVIFIGTGVVAALWSIAQTWPRLLRFFLDVGEDAVWEEADAPDEYHEEHWNQNQMGAQAYELHGCLDEQEELLGELHDFEERSLRGLKKVRPLGQDHPAQTTPWQWLRSCFCPCPEDDFVVARAGPTLAQMLCVLMRLAVGMDVAEAMPHEQASGHLALRKTRRPARELPTFLQALPLCGCSDWTEYEREEGGRSKFVEKGNPNNWVIPLSSREVLQKVDGQLYLLIERSNALNKLLKFLLGYLPQVALVATGVASGSFSLRIAGIILGVLPILFAFQQCLYKHRQRCKGGQSHSPSQNPSPGQGQIVAATTPGAADPPQTQMQMQTPQTQTPQTQTSPNSLASGGSDGSRLSKDTLNYLWDWVPVRLLKRGRRGLPQALQLLVDFAAPIALIWQNRENPGLAFTSVSGLLAVILANLREHGPQLALHMNLVPSGGGGGSSRGCGCLGVVLRQLLQPPRKLSGAALTVARLSGAVASLVMLFTLPGGDAAATAAVELVRLSSVFAEEGRKMNLRARESTSPSVKTSVGPDGKQRLLDEVAEQGWIQPDGPFLNFVCGGLARLPVRKVAYSNSMHEVLAEVQLFLLSKLPEEMQGGKGKGKGKGKGEALRPGWKKMNSDYPLKQMVTFQERNTKRGTDPPTTTREFLEQTMQTIEGNNNEVDGMVAVTWAHEVAIVRGYTLADVNEEMGCAGPNDQAPKGVSRTQVVVSEGPSGEQLTPQNVERLNIAMNWVLKAAVGQWEKGKAPQLYVKGPPRPPQSRKTDDLLWI